jgi:hypothetical protein
MNSGRQNTFVAKCETKQVSFSIVYHNKKTNSMIAMDIQTCASNHPRIATPASNDRYKSRTSNISANSTSEQRPPVDCDKISKLKESLPTTIAFTIFGKFFSKM